MIAKVTGVLLIAATIAAGVYVDIVWLLVGGIKEIVHGAEAHPVSAGQIGWGAAHVIFTGLGVSAAVLLCMGWAALFLARSANKRPDPSLRRTFR